jgi:hypothetical protein
MHVCVHRETSSRVAVRVQHTRWCACVCWEHVCDLPCGVCMVSIVRRSHGFFLVTEPNPVVCSFSSHQPCVTLFSLLPCRTILSAFGCKGWCSRLVSPGYGCWGLFWAAACCLLGHMLQGSVALGFVLSFRDSYHLYWKHDGCVMLI